MRGGVLRHFDVGVRSPAAERVMSPSVTMFKPSVSRPRAAVTWGQPLYAGAMTFVKLLHVALAVFLIGPLTVVVAATPAAIRGGAPSVPLLRWFARTTRFYGLATVLVLVLGIALVSPDYSYGQLWIWGSLVLFAVAIVLLLRVVEPGQQAALEAIEAGGDTAGLEKRLLAVGGVVSLCWVAILALMIYQPGL